MILKLLRLLILSTLLNACSENTVLREALLSSEKSKLYHLTKMPNGDPVPDQVWEIHVSGDSNYIGFLVQSQIAAIHNDGSYQVYFYKKSDQSIFLASTKSDGSLPDGSTDQFDINKDGSRLVIKTFATDLHAALATNTGRQIIVKDLNSGAILLGSFTSSDVMANSTQHHVPKISDDGNFIAFPGTPTNLTGSTGNEVFRKNISTKAISLSSADATNIEDNNAAFFCGISPDGSRVSFTSNSSAWAASPGTPGYYGIYLKNHNDGSLILASKDDAGNPVHSISHYQSNYVLADNVTVAFLSPDTVLSSYPNNGKAQIYLRNTNTGAIQLATSSKSGVLANEKAEQFFDVTPDGKYVVFSSTSTNLIDGQTLSSRMRVYRKNMSTGNIEIVSSNDDGQSNSSFDAFNPSISDDGKWIAFLSKEDFFDLGNTVEQGYLKYLP